MKLCMNSVLLLATPILLSIVPSCGDSDFSDSVPPNQSEQPTSDDNPEGNQTNSNNQPNSSEDNKNKSNKDGTDKPSDTPPNGPEFDPSAHPGDDPRVIHEDFGVFVAPSGDDRINCGSRSKPCATIGRALHLAIDEKKSVFVCGSSAHYDENLKVDSSVDGVRLFGGFRCETWTYQPSNTRSRIQPQSGTALSVDGLLLGIELNDFEFVSSDAQDGSENSIAAIIRDSDGVFLRNVLIVSGNAGSGNHGLHGSSGETPLLVGSNQLTYGEPAECSSDFVADSSERKAGGRWPGPFACDAGGYTQGGNGGDGAVALHVGNSGFTGEPQTNLQYPNHGAGGTGSHCPNHPPKPGQPGSSGNHGINGGPPIAGILSETGYAPSRGSHGTNGFPGQGGGGGGGGSSELYDIYVCLGGGGGAGGLGGCGGFYGNGGYGGGASIAMISWSATITLENCTLRANNGGNGGNGGKGGIGSSGELGAIAELRQPGSPGGSGGKGGKGGNGGNGAGGSGGPSHALVVHGKLPTEIGSTWFSHGSGGSKGTGGQAEGSQRAPDGLDGASSAKVIVQ